MRSPLAPGGHFGAALSKYEKFLAKLIVHYSNPTLIPPQKPCSLSCLCWGEFSNQNLGVAPERLDTTKHVPRRYLQITGFKPTCSQLRNSIQQEDFKEHHLGETALPASIHETHIYWILTTIIIAKSAFFLASFLRRTTEIAIADNASLLALQENLYKASSVSSFLSISLKQFNFKPFPQHAFDQNRLKRNIPPSSDKATQKSLLFPILLLAFIPAIPIYHTTMKSTEDLLVVHLKQDC
jgi:hypothetical protein